MAKNGLSANRKSAQKDAAKKRPQTWKPGQSGNPKGSPRRGQSWAEIIKSVSDMTPAEAATFCRSIAGELRKLGDEITLKEAVVLRVFTSLIFEPQPGLLNAFMDRADGKLTQPLIIDSRNEVISLIRSNKLSWDEVNAELGYSLAAELFREAGVAIRQEIQESDRENGSRE